MNTKEFYRKIEKDVLAHVDTVNPQHLHLLKDLKITSLEQALGVFRAILELNVRFHQDTIDIQKQIDGIMNEHDLTEDDLDS
jgi:hypothetical protein